MSSLENINIASNKPDLLTSVRPNKKAEKKQEEELFYLSALVQEIEEEVGAKKAGKKARDPKIVSLEDASKENQSQKALEEAMVMLAELMQELQVDISKFQENQSVGQVNASKAIAKMYEIIQKKMEKTIAKQKAEQAKQKKTDTIIKIFTVVAGVILAAIAIALGQPEIAILIIGMTILAVSGAFQAIEKALAKPIAKMLETDFHMKKKEAKLVANIIAIVIVTAVTIALTAVLAPEDIPEEAVEAGEEISENVADSSAEAADSANNAESTAQQAKNMASKAMRAVRQFTRKINLFNRLSTRTNMMIMNGTQAAMQSNLTQTVTDAIVQIDEANGKKLSKKEKERIEQIVTYVLLALSVIVTLGSGDAVADGMTNMGKGTGASFARSGLTKLIGEDNAVFKALGKIAEPITQFAKMKGVVPLAEFGRQAAMGVADGFTIKEGTILIDQGNLEEKLAEASSMEEILQTVMEQMENVIKDAQKNESEQLKSHRLDGQKDKEEFAGMAALANVLANPV